VQELRQQATAVITEEVSADDFDRALDKARRTARAGAKALEQMSKMDLGGDRRTRLMLALRAASQEICRLMMDHVSGKVLLGR
jgi:hypothetical protein